MPGVGPYSGGSSADLRDTVPVPAGSLVPPWCPHRPEHTSLLLLETLCESSRILGFSRFSLILHTENVTFQSPSPGKKKNSRPKGTLFFLVLAQSFYRTSWAFKGTVCIDFRPWPPGFIAAVFWTKAPYRNPSGLNSGSLGDWTILEAVSLYKPSQMAFVACHLLFLWGSSHRIFPVWLETFNLSSGQNFCEEMEALPMALLRLPAKLFWVLVPPPQPNTHLGMDCISSCRISICYCISFPRLPQHNTAD